MFDYRRIQYFIPPEHVAKEGMRKSVWFRDGYIWMPRGCWDAITRLLERLSEQDRYFHETISLGDGELYEVDLANCAEAANSYLRIMKSALELIQASEDKIPEFDFQEDGPDYPNFEYAAMLEWVIWVVEESLNTGEKFRAWPE